MTEWTLNTSPSPLAKGMLVRRPGLDEALEIVKVTGTDFKIKLPGGKTATLPLGAEVEWSRPESSAQSQSQSRSQPEVDSAVEVENEGEIDTDTEWLTDWSLLDVGSKIEVLGEPGDFTILRLTDSNARIKHNATGQIQPMSIGHKFKIVDGGTVSTKPDSSKPAKDKAKSRASKKSIAKSPEPEIVEPDPENESDPEPAVIVDTEPSDEDLTAIENGDDIDIDPGADGYDDDLDTLDDNEDDDTDNESILPLDNDETDNDDDNTEDDDMPAPAPKPAKAPRSASTSLLTVGQISDRTGISYPTLMRYIRDHADRLPSEGEGRSRRFLPEAIEVFKQIRSETKGGRPGKGGNKPVNPVGPRKMPSKPITAKPRGDRNDRIERSHETAAPYAAPYTTPARSAQTKTATRTDSNQSSLAGEQTIDGMLASAIEHARARIAGFESLIDNLEAQREALKLWS